MVFGCPLVRSVENLSVQQLARVVDVNGGILVEVGFMSNPSDQKILNSPASRTEIAQTLFNAFKTFKKKYDGSVDYSVDAGKTDAAVQAPEAAPAVNQVDASYGVQILVLSRRLKDGDRALKGYDAEVYPAGRMYKYIIGISSTEAEARKTLASIRKKFPDAFVVRIEDGAVTRL